MPFRPHQRIDQVREQHISIIADRYLEGVPMYKIADEIGVHRDTVSRDIRELHKRWAESSISNYNELKQRELARIDKVELECWRAWRRSQNDTTKNVERRKTDGKNSDDASDQDGEYENTTTRTSTPGDP